jgi:hypothetical protein
LKIDEPLDAPLDNRAQSCGLSLSTLIQGVSTPWRTAAAHPLARLIAGEEVHMAEMTVEAPGAPGDAELVEIVNRVGGLVQNFAILELMVAASQPVPNADVCFFESMWP